MNVAVLLSQRAARLPQALALIDRSGGRTRETTFEQLEAAAARAAGEFAAAGLAAGDRMLVFHPMSTELYVSLIGALRLGLVVTFVDPSNGVDYLERCCEVARPAALFTSPLAQLLRWRSAALRAIRRNWCSRPFPGAAALLAGGGGESAKTVDCQDDAPALLTFTSGSTGLPKGVARSHGVLAAQLDALRATLSLTDGETSVATMPIVLLANLASGVTSLIPSVDLRRPGSVDGAVLAMQAIEARATTMVASPALLDRMAEQCAAHGLALPHFKAIYAGGAPVFPSLSQRIQSIASQSAIVAVYGSTEAEPIAHIGLTEIDARDHAAMKAGAGLLAGVPDRVQLRILPDRWGTPIAPLTADELNHLSLPAGKAGEIAVSGPHVVKGYLDGRGDEETKFRVDGEIWHRPGDAGYLDERGRLWLLGRCVAKIEDERGTLYPFAVECAASYLPNVPRTAVAAHASKRFLLYEKVGGSRFNPAALRAALGWAQIDEIVEVARLPVDRRHNAKIDYPALERMLARHG